MQIKVRTEHIENGRHGSERSCPIALAIKDAIPDLFEIRVMTDTVWMRKFHEEGKYHVLPYKARNFVVHFDELEDVGPFEFEL